MVSSLIIKMSTTTTTLVLVFIAHLAVSADGLQLQRTMTTAASASEVRSDQNAAKTLEEEHGPSLVDLPDELLMQIGGGGDWKSVSTFMQSARAFRENEGLKKIRREKIARRNEILERDVREAPPMYVSLDAGLIMITALCANESLVRTFESTFQIRSRPSIAAVISDERSHHIKVETCYFVYKLKEEGDSVLHGLSFVYKSGDGQSIFHGKFRYHPPWTWTVFSERDLYVDVPNAIGELGDVRFQHVLTVKDKNETIAEFLERSGRPYAHEMVTVAKENAALMKHRHGWPTSPQGAYYGQDDINYIFHPPSFL